MFHDILIFGIPLLPEHLTEGIGGDTFLNDWEDTHIHISSLHSLHAIDLGAGDGKRGQGWQPPKSGEALLVSNNLCNLAFSKYLGVDGNGTLGPLWMGQVGAELSRVARGGKGRVAE